MRTPAYLCLLLTCMLISCTPTQEKHEIDYTSYVNPFIGTDFTGNTYPGAQAPFGMVQLSPDNGLPGWDRISGYFYPDSRQYDCRFQPHTSFRHWSGRFV
jgi:putative alpha-1,2-mannosidase